MKSLAETSTAVEEILDSSTKAPVGRGRRRGRRRCSKLARPRIIALPVCSQFARVLMLNPFPELAAGQIWWTGLTSTSFLDSMPCPGFFLEPCVNRGARHTTYCCSFYELRVFVAQAFGKNPFVRR